MNEQPWLSKGLMKWRDWSIGIADGASIAMVLMAGFVGAEWLKHEIVVGLWIAVALMSLVLGFVSYTTIKSLWISYQKSIRLQSDEMLMDKAIQEKQQFLSNLEMQSDIIAASVDEVKDESDADAALHFAPPTLPEAKQTGWSIGIASFIGGTLPILPFLLTIPTLSASYISGCIALLLVFIAQNVKSRVTDVAPWFGSISNTLLTLIAAVAVYFLIQWVAM